MQPKNTYGDRDGGDRDGNVILLAPFSYHSPANHQRKIVQH